MKIERDGKWKWYIFTHRDTGLVVDFRLSRKEAMCMADKLMDMVADDEQREQETVEAALRRTLK